MFHFKNCNSGFWEFIMFNITFSWQLSRFRPLNIVRMSPTLTRACFKPNQYRRAFSLARLQPLSGKRARAPPHIHFTSRGGTYTRLKKRRKSSLAFSGVPTETIILIFLLLFNFRCQRSLHDRKNLSLFLSVNNSNLKIESTYEIK